MICVTGANGQLGLHIQEHLSKKCYEYIPVERSKLDISNDEEVKNFFKNINLTLLINAAAYTDVEKAERNIQEAYLVNEKGVRNLTNICNLKDAPIVHFSTDYVFNGTSTMPYQSEDKTDPINVYGQSKLAGELILKKHANKFLLVRTSWVFSEYGKNFFKTILNLAKENTVLKIVSDQYGNPTYAGDLAQALVSAIPEIFSSRNINQIYHYGGDDTCSWYEFANEICTQAVSQKILDQMPNIIPVPASEFITDANRPMYSVLDSSNFCSNFNQIKSNWKLAITKILKDN